jgi:ubiquinone/menaquinone biosynthesis C-methylase UbiE
MVIGENSLRSYLFLIFAALVLVCSCEEQGRWSKEWEEKFESFQPSGKIIDVMGIKPGMHVGEIGAGNGRFAVRVAERVGDTGRVYANDIDPKAVRFMERRCKRGQIKNMTVIRGGEVQPRFPEGRLDLVYLINTYDHLSDPVTLLRNTLASLKPGGRLAVIAYDPDKMPDHRGHAVSKGTVIEQCRQAGFELDSIDTTFIYDNVYVFRIRESMQ